MSLHYAAAAPTPISITLRADGAPRLIFFI